jgi:hypothetical protein
MTQRLPNYVYVCLLLGSVLLLHIFYYPYFPDDSYISLRYAQRLLHGQGLTWNDGEYVEGYSNLLWVLLTAALGFIGFNLVDAASALGITCTLLTPLVFFYHQRQAKLSYAALLIGLVAYVASPPIALWARAGLETPMVMLLLTSAVTSCYGLLTEYRRRQACITGALLGLTCLLRPEAPLYVAGIMLALLMHSRNTFERVRTIVIIGGTAALFFLSQMLFRMHYYGELLPNTVLAKVAFSTERLMTGYVYVAKALLVFMPLWLYALLGLTHARKSSRREEARFGLFALTFLAVLSLAIVISGGDVFMGFRAFAPLLPTLILAGMQTASIELEKRDVREKYFVALILVCFIALQSMVDVTRNKTSEGTLYGEYIGRILKQRYAEKKPLVAVYAAGAVPYYSELPSFDVLGLNNKELTHRRYEIAQFGKGAIGHDLFDAAYIESKKPDILVFDIPGFLPICEQPANIEGCKDLLSHYKPERLELPGAAATIWLRKDSQKITGR